MKFQIKTAHGKNLNLSAIIPQEYSSLLLSDARTSFTEGIFGAMLFQRILGDGFEILYNQYFIKEPSTFTWTSDRMLLQLHVVLKNTFSPTLPGIGSTTIRKEQFNMTYLPVVDTPVQFAPGHYTSFHIHYSKDYLEKYAYMLPPLKAFLENIEKGIACQLFPAHPFAPPDMISVINQILDARYNEPLQKIYYDIKVSELLFFALRPTDQKEGGNGIPINAHDEMKMQEVKEWLENNLDSPLTLPEIARLIGTNEFKLKKGFKQVFGTTVFDYLLKLRMERARQLLKETNKQIHEIAYLTGYSSHSAFTNAFTRHFGYSPVYLRKK